MQFAKTTRRPLSLQARTSTPRSHRGFRARSELVQNLSAGILIASFLVMALFG